MNSLVFLIPLSILLLVGAGLALFWAVDHGQFEDMDTSGLLPVLDAEPEPASPPLRDACAGDSHAPARPAP